MMVKKISSFFFSNKFFIFFFLLYNFFLVTWNYNYLPITEGWFLLAGKLISEGKLPYIDFYAYLTPFYYWFSYFIYQLGENLIFHARLIGQVIFCLIFYYTYAFFRINFNSLVSSIATFFSLLVYLSSAAIITYDFTHLITLFSLISIVLIINSNNKFGYFFSGVFSSLVFLTKQSNGFVIFIFLAIIFIVKNRNDIKKLIYPLSGILITFLIVLYPIILNNGFKDFFFQITLHAGNSKGGIISSLTNLFPPKSDYYSIKNIFNFLFDTFLPLLILFLAFYKIKSKDIVQKESKLLSYSTYLIIFYFILIITFGLYLGIRFNFIDNINIFFWNKAYLWSGYYVFFLLLLSKYTRFNNYSLIFLFGLIIASATSAGLTAVSIFLHLGFMIGILFHFKSIFNSSFILGIILLISIPTHSIFKKYDTGYYWWGVNAKLGSKISTDNIIIKNIQNNGFSSDLDTINSIIQSCKKSPKNLLSFPHTTMLNLSTGLNPPGKAITYWFDFLSNEHSAKELMLLQNTNIDIIAIIEMEKIAWEVHDNLFRKGKGLEQEKVLNYIMRIANSEDYLKMYENKINDRFVNIYIRKDFNCKIKD